MIKDLEVINSFFDLKNEFILKDEKGGYYLKYLKKLKKEITDEEKNRILSKINNKYVNKFIDVMINNGKEKYLNNLYSNLRITKIIDCEMIQNLIAKNSSTYGGNYYIGGKIILLLGDKINIENYVVNLTPYHELLHLLTTKIENENVISIGISSNTFCDGINEGYTELLTQRYFGYLSEEEVDTYNVYKWFSFMIEEIVGRELFEKCYFEVNQDLFIKELSNYSSEKDVIELINVIDCLFNNEDKVYSIECELLENKTKRIDELKMLYNESSTLRNYAFNSLINIHKNKMNKLLNDNIIDSKTYLELTNDYYKKNKLIKSEIDNTSDVYSEYVEEFKQKLL